MEWEGGDSAEWVQPGGYCGTKGQHRPIQGLEVEIFGALAETHDVVYAGCFEGGIRSPLRRNGEACSAEGRALEAMKVEVHPKPQP